jgi:hypothetical protein
MAGVPPRTGDAGRRPPSRPEPTDRAVALYHRVYPEESFEVAARVLWDLVRRAEQDHPGTPRTLYLDIEGHRNDQGGYDSDMFELQQNFLLGFLLPFLTEAHLPLGLSVRNPRAQRGDLPDELMITPAGAEE